jgi:DNA-binding NtrC family response regulator
MGEGMIMKPKSILIACRDERENRSLPTLFHDLEYCVEEAGRVSEVIRKVREGNIHVILLDDEIEGIKAYDLIPLLRANPKVQVIIISSEESLRFVKRLRGAGIFYHALKPVDPQEIRSAVECAFEKIERESLRDESFFFWIPGWVPA